MTRAVPRADRQSLARETLREVLPLARSSGYGRVRIDITERGAMTIVAEIGETQDEPPAPLDV